MIPYENHSKYLHLVIVIVYINRPNGANNVTSTSLNANNSVSWCLILLVILRANGSILWYSTMPSDLPDEEPVGYRYKWSCDVKFTLISFSIFFGLWLP